MAVVTARTGARSWATPTDWVGDACPVDNVDSFVLPADCQMLMNQDQGAWTGLLGGTIASHATTPGMLYWATGTSGTLKIKTGFSVQGDATGVAKGRILANASGVWGETGALPFANKAIISLAGTAQIAARYLDLNLYDTEPANAYVTTYKQKFDFTASGTTVNTTTGVIDISPGTPPAANTAIKIRSLGGTLPTGLHADDIYYVYAVSGSTFKLALQSNIANTVVIPTSTGSGALTLYTGHTDTATGAMNVFEDVTADLWTTGDPVVLTNIGPQAEDVQRATATITSASVITLSANVDSVQYPGARIWLSRRNVSIRSAGTTAGQAIITYFSSTGGQGSGNVLRCELINTGGTGTTYYGYGISRGTGFTFSGVITGCANGFEGNNASTAGTISGIILAGGAGLTSVSQVTFSGKIAGMTYGLSSCQSVNVTGEIHGCGVAIGNINSLCTANGVITGCNQGLGSNGAGNTHTGIIRSCASGITTTPGIMAGTMRGCAIGIATAGSDCISTIEYCNAGASITSARFAGSINKCSNGVNTGVGASISGTISNCVNGLNNPVGGYGINLVLTGNTTDVLWTPASQQNCRPFRSFKHGGLANDTRAWCSGGTLTHETTEVPSGKAYSHKFTHTLATFLTLMEWDIDRPFAGPISIVVYAKHDATSLAEVARIHWEIVDRGSDPLCGGVALDSFIAADSTAWQSDTLTYTKEDDRPLILRAYCTRGSGNSYIYFEPQVASAGSSGGCPIIGGSIVRRA